jgi:hypothetical protein
VVLAASRVYAGFFLAFDTSPGGCRAPTLSILYNHLTPLSAALDPLTLCMCSCFSPAQRFQLRFDNAGSWSNRRGQCTRILYAVVVVGATLGFTLYGPWTLKDR